MRWKIQDICSKMVTKIFEVDEEMSEIIDAKVGNPQNSTSKKWANFSQPWNLEFFHDYIFKKYVYFQSQRVPKWKIAHIWQSKEHKNNKKTPYNVSVICCQSLPVVLQHPVYTNYCCVTCAMRKCRNICLIMKAYKWYNTYNHNQTRTWKTEGCLKNTQWGER